MRTLLHAVLVAFVAALLPAAAGAQSEPKIGVVVMHGKGGSPHSRAIAPFAAALERNGFLVANLDMPWSGARNYDVDVAAAERQVKEALEALKGKGAEKLFVSGHSQGGVFAIHVASRVRVDGVVTIAPGGSVSSRVFREKLGQSLEEARRLVADGKGAEKQRLADYEGSRGTYPVIAVPQAYVTWFDPEGAMNVIRAAKAVPPSTPVLYVAPTRDYPGLRSTRQQVFGSLPAHPQSRMVEPDAEHLHAPVATVDEMTRWMREVASKRGG